MATEEKVPHHIRYSFTITYILLLTTATITFIEAMRTKSPVVRHVLNLETCISIVAGYFYSVFIGNLDEYEDKNEDIEWQDITMARYIDWSITTPLMLLALCIVLSNEIGVVIHLPVMLGVIALNYAMLYTGHLGETGVLERNLAAFLGFVPFIAMFGLIYWNYVRPKYDLANRILFFVYLTIWSLYGLVYTLDVDTKNMAMNALDLTAKCLIGLGLWVYYVHIVRL
jgi:bacteriorhodopsin